ncbi:MAG: glycosyltransferase family 2 protein [Candidatus Aenigmatarchaeota archaeon]
MSLGDPSLVNVPVSVIILTLNEEANIEYCLKSVYNWSDDIHIVDSFSVDNTISLAMKYTKNIHKVKEAHWADLRNWAIRNLQLKHEWVLFLDADERLTEELKREIYETLKRSPEVNGFYIKRRFIFLGKWLKHGGLYVKVLRLFRHKFAEYIAEGDVEYAIVKGKVGLMKYDIIHEDRKGIFKWTEKHNKISDRAAKQYLAGQTLPKKYEKDIELEGGRRTWMKYALWEKIPLPLQPFLIFIYHYFFRLGFLDGLEGLIYALLQGFWYRLLIYAKVLEAQKPS